MFYGETVQDTRQMFFSSWKKYQQKEPLLPLEQQIVAVILDHPEYFAMLDAPAGHQDQRYYPELGQTNPFLHMGLHLAIRDQISTNKPDGITAIYKKLLKKYNEKLIVEHLIMDFFAECLWTAQRNNNLPNDQQYLKALTQLLH